jgi:hypothetical protein
LTKITLRIARGCDLEYTIALPHSVRPEVNRFKMTLTEFRASLSASEPPAGLTPALVGLWWDAKGDWTRAHESAQQDEGMEGSWVHAYLHRKEGDQSNAAFTGTVGQASPSAGSRSMRNGSAL